MPASRSLIALLVGTVAFFALWLIALKPSGSGGGSGSSSSQGVGQYQTALNKAHQAVATSNASNAASGNAGTASSASTSTSSPSGSSTKPATHAATKAKVPHLTAKVGAHNRATLVRLSTVQHALTARKMVVMLFFNPAAADDQAVKQELAGIPTHRGKVVKLTIPLSEAANFTAVTQQVPVNFSPTLVLIAPSGQTNEIVGFTDPFEIAQRIDDGLTSR